MKKGRPVNFRRMLWPLLLTLSGCAMVLPQVQYSGRYAQIYANDFPVVEIEYPSIEECVRNMNAGIAEADLDAGMALIRGKVRVVCSPFSIAEQLPHTGKAVNTITGSTMAARYKSLDTCMAFERINQIPAIQYICE